MPRELRSSHFLMSKDCAVQEMKPMLLRVPRPIGVKRSDHIIVRILGQRVGKMGVAARTVVKIIVKTPATTAGGVGTASKRQR